MRLFLAIDPGDECRHYLAGIVESIRVNTSGIRWVSESKFHLTLAFLGEVDESQVNVISAAVRAVAARHAPFTASVAGAGVFPDWRRVRVVWLGIRDSGSLAELGNDMTDMSARLGFPQRAFRAHLTIGRTTGPLSAEQKGDLSRALAPRRDKSYPFEVTRVVLMHSAPGADGSTYSELASFPLSGA